MGLIRGLIFFVVVAVIPAYFMNRWLLNTIRPKESWVRLAAFILCIAAAAMLYSALGWWLLQQTIWPLR